ncbi:MAG: DUF1573 domain-containing protein [Planctomycetota bacterium]
MLRTLALSLPALLFACAPEGTESSAGTMVFVAAEASDDARPYFHDFGRVSEGAVAHHTFKLVNPGPGAVRILKLVPSCGCTVPSLRAYRPDGTEVVGQPQGDEGPRIVVEAGDRLELTVRVDTKDVRQKNQDMLYTLRVSTDASENRYITLELRLHVAAPWSMNPPVGIQLGAIPIGGESKGTVDVVRAGSNLHTIGELIEVPEGVDASVERIHQSGIDVWRIEAGFRPPIERGSHATKLVLSTTDELGEPADDLSIPLAAVGVPDVQADPQRFAMRVTPGERSEPARRSETRVASLLPGHTFRVLEARLEGAHAEQLEVTFEPERADADGSAARWRVVLASAEPLPEGIHRGDVRVLLDDPQYPEIVIPYVLHARGGS